MPFIELEAPFVGMIGEVLQVLLQRVLAGVLAVGCALGGTFSVAAEGDKVLVNVDKNGVAFKGYCPVCSVDAGKAVKGDPKFAAKHQGATYYFVDADTMKKFQANPEKYVPAYGGYCAYGVGAAGQLFDIDPTTAQVVNGRLIVNKDASIMKLFNEDAAGFIKKADGAWPKLVEAKGKAAPKK